MVKTTNKRFCREGVSFVGRGGGVEREREMEERGWYGEYTRETKELYRTRDDGGRNFMRKNQRKNAVTN